jgi:hypothetical protein
MQDIYQLVNEAYVDEENGIVSCVTPAVNRHMAWAPSDTSIAGQDCCMDRYDRQFGVPPYSLSRSLKSRAAVNCTRTCVLHGLTAPRPMAAGLA